MTVLVYQTAGHYSRSILCARLVAKIETDNLPEDEQAFADQCDGDFIEVTSVDPGDNQ